MPSRSPDSHVEALESRCVPARLFGGPLPSEFGADLSRVDTLPPDTDPAQSITIGPITPLSEYHSPWSLSGALVELGSGELHVSQPPLLTWDGSLPINGGILVASTTTIYGGTLQMSGGTLSFGSFSANASITFSAGILRLDGLNARYAQLGRPSPPVALPVDISLPIAPGTLLELTSSPEAPATILAPFVG